MGIPAQEGKRRWRRRHLIELAVAVAAVVVVGVAGADVIATDGDTSESPPNISYTVGGTGSSHACSTRGTAVPGQSRISFNGSSHYTAGETVTVTPTLDAAGVTAGVTASGGTATVPNPWTGGSFTRTLSTTTPLTAPDGVYTVTVTAVGGTSGKTLTDPYTVTVSCATPTVTINQASGQSDPTGTSPINFTVTFSEPVSGFAAADVTLSGTAGATTKVVTGGPTVYNVAVSGMTSNGTVTASIPANAAQDVDGNNSSASTSADNTVTYSVAPPSPNLSVNDVSLNEGNAGTTSFTFTVSLSSAAPAGGVAFAIATADNTAAQPSDYTQKSLTSQTIPAGNSTYSFSVLVNGDVVTEANETFFVNVTNVTGATVTDGQGQGTITNDDAADTAPSVSSTVPANNATGVPRNSDVIVNFSESVSVDSDWFTLSCATSGVHTGTTNPASGFASMFTINPAADFVKGEHCTLTITSGKVHDQDGNDPPDNLAVNFVAGFDTVVNVAPTADAGGAYTGNEGAQVALDGTGSTDSDGTIASYLWSVTPHSGGLNDPDTGAACSFVDGTTSTSDAPKVACTDDGVYDVSLTVTDNDGAPDTDTTTLTLSNVDPTATKNFGTSVNEGTAFSLALTGGSDAGSNDTLTYAFDCGSGYGAASATASESCPTTDDGTRSVKAKIIDDDVGFTEYTGSVTISNVAPSIAISGNASVNEGSSYSLTLGTITDPGADTVTSWVVHWGDGSDTYGSGGVKTHTYADGPNDYNITVDLIDEDDTFLDRANVLGVHVSNVAPSIAISGNASVNEGSSYSLTLGTITDPGADTVTSWVVHWGDGSDTYGSGGVKTHTYADGPNDYNITVDLIDEDDTFLDRANVLGVHVSNVAPSIAISGNASVNEGSSYSLTLGTITDPGADTVTSWVVHWGDGSDTYGSGGVKTHTYADGPNDYNITVDLIDEDDTFLDRANVLGVHVSNVAPSIAISGNASVNEGSSYSLTLGTITDPGADTVTSWVVHWGDGSDTYGSGGVKTHTYADGPNDYNITVDLIDEDDTFLDRANVLGVHVSNVAPSIAISGNASVNEGSSYSLTLGTITDPGADTVTSWVVHWGDGSDTYGSGGVKTHTYADGPNDYNITVDLIDEDDTFLDRANVLGVHVSNVAPSIAISGNASVNEGSSYSLTLGTITDPGADTVTSWVVHWGDGSDTYGSGGVKTHTYADGPNDYNITVDLIDEDDTFLDRANVLGVHVNNVAPTVVLSGDFTSVDEGTTRTYTYTVTDPGADSPTVVESCGSGATPVTDLVANSFKCKFLDGPGSSTVNATADDGDPTNNTGDNPRPVSILNVAPTVSSVAFSATTASCAVGGATNVSLSITFTDPGVDTHKAEIDWNNDGTYDQTVDPYTSGTTIPHLYASAGMYTAKVRITDSDGAVSVTTPTANVTVNYNLSGILQPVNDTRNGQQPSMFKYGSTIPVKVEITKCDGSHPSNLVVTVTATLLNSNPPPATIDEDVVATTPDASNTMRFSDPIYILNWNTKTISDSSSTVGVKVTIQATNQSVSANIGLKAK